jgi:hypothetical protein
MIDAKLSDENASSPPDFWTIMFAGVQLIANRISDLLQHIRLWRT